MKGVATAVGSRSSLALNVQSSKLNMSMSMAIPSGSTNSFVVRCCTHRRKDLMNWPNHDKLRLQCESDPTAARSSDNEGARVGFSEAGLDVEANTAPDRFIPACNDSREPWKKSGSEIAWKVTCANGHGAGVSYGGHVIPLSQQAQQEERDRLAIGITEEVRNSTQSLQNQNIVQDANIMTDGPQKSIEEAFGLLKEQVEADSRERIGSKQGSEDTSITDATKPSIPDATKPLKRSKILAKQVISQSSARAVGFVSQLWVSTRLCKVIAFEVRPSLLSGETDRVFLNDVCQVGDVVLVNDESALENETTALDCETLVGYDVVTEGGKFIGKIRDYSFDLDDGKLTSLDFDSVGFSLVPSSLISTYRLTLEEVIEVLPDCILVKDGAEFRIRRLTKGFWQLPGSGEQRRSQKIARSRVLKKNRGDGGDDDEVSAAARQLPPSLRPRYFDGTESVGQDEQVEPAERGTLPKYNGRIRPRYRW